MSDTVATWVAILGVSLTSLATRASFAAFGTRLALPPLVERALRFAPAAVLGALVVPALVLSHGQVDLGAGNQRLVAAGVGAVVMWRSRSMIASIVAGMAALTLLRLHGG
jgi:branched-subunit amino acid transport protein